MEPGNRNAGRLGEIVGELEAAGYRSQMAARPDGQVICFTCHQASAAAAFAVATLERTEGASDPADMLAVAALTCPQCGARGTIVLGYGPEASDDDAEVLANLHMPEGS